MKMVFFKFPYLLNLFENYFIFLFQNFFDSLLRLPCDVFLHQLKDIAKVSTQ